MTDAADLIERLTAEVERLQDPCGYIALLREELADYRALGHIDHQRELVEAERLVGETVYAIRCTRYGSGKKRHWIDEAVVTEVACDKNGWHIHAGAVRNALASLGKTVFLTRAEAEAAQGGGGDG